MTAAFAQKLGSAFALVVFAMAILFAHLRGDENPAARSTVQPASALPPYFAKSVSVPDLPTSPPEEASAAFAAGSIALSQQVELAQLAGAHHLELTSEQLVLFASITRTAQSERRRYEAAIATVLPGASDPIKLVIPTYPLIGDKLRAHYYWQLAQDLGAEKAGEIRAALGADLESLFADFGSSEQGLEVSRQTGPAGLEYVVNTISVFPWDPSEPAYAVHRETHLLPTEDPTGSDWGAFSARFAR